LVISAQAEIFSRVLKMLTEGLRLREDGGGGFEFDETMF